VAAVGCAFSALCYAEFASLVPVAGSAYTYSYATLGEFFAWIIGWDLVLEYSVGAATVAISWSQYLVRFLTNYGIYLPPQLVASPFEKITLHDGTLVNGIFNLPAVLIIVFITLVIIRGIKGSAVFTSIIVAIKISVVLVFIGIGWSYINPGNYVPYIPENTSFGVLAWFSLSLLGLTSLLPWRRKQRTPNGICPSAFSGHSLFVPFFSVFLATC
jgi:APA family basic amino acid/polyamine antiporter